MNDHLEGSDLEKCNTNNGHQEAKQDHPRNNGDGREKRGRILSSPWTSYSRTWGKIFLASCVVAVSIDPLFLYIPVINEDNKCLAIDEKMKNVALILRSLTDFTYLLHLFFRLKIALSMAKEFHLSLRTGFPWAYLFIDIVAILPIPQVIILTHFSTIAGSRSLTERKVLNLLLLLQYVPRILRVYLSAKELGRTFDSLTRRMWVRGVFNFFLYVMVGHLFGGFWYFYSIYRETACWHHACKSYQGCDPSDPFDCRGNIPLTNLTFINNFCPTNPPKPDVFDFGIYSDAIASRILVTTTKFLDKYTRCFWWGLRNMSSFGSNLNTSKNIEENFFAALISILGLFMFLYLIGNLQTYMQLETAKSEAIRHKINTKEPEIQSYLSKHGLSKSKTKLIMRYLSGTMKQDKEVDVKHLLSLLEEDIQNNQEIQYQNNKSFALWVTKLLDAEKQEKKSKDFEAELWIKKSNIPQNLRTKIMQYVKLRLREGNDVDARNILSILPSNLVISVKEHLCFPILRKVPMLANLDERVPEIYRYLKPMTFQERSYIIRQGEPLDLMLFITQGFAWTFEGGGRGSSSKRSRLEAGDYHGDELLAWILAKNMNQKQNKNTTESMYCDFPISNCNVKSSTKVEAFAIMANDLEELVVKFWWKFHPNTEEAREALTPFAAMSLQAQFRRFAARKK